MLYPLLTFIVLFQVISSITFKKQIFFNTLKYYLLLDVKTA